MKKYRNPVPTVDIIIQLGKNAIVLIERANPPHGWALPGGYVDYGESLEEAAVREAKEETSLDIELLSQFHTYSDPQRDSRQHNISTVFVARSSGIPKGATDARRADVFFEDSLPGPLVFDHSQILRDYFQAVRANEGAQWYVKRIKP
ncbi:MAG: NUDIX hydrolase [Nitrospinaceae bacterium]|nr:MAG: NUDIX hydrolase [Nitrospinaceae bacterium]